MGDCRLGLKMQDQVRGHIYTKVGDSPYTGKKVRRTMCTDQQSNLYDCSRRLLVHVSGSVFTRSGNYNRALGGVRNMTTNGNWWSSTVGSATNARNLNTNTGNVNAENNNQRGNGLSVRCVAR